MARLPMTGPTTVSATSIPLTVQEAVFVVALNGYLVERLEYGERVDMAMADKVAGIAATTGIHPKVNLLLFGFSIVNGTLRPLSPELVQRAIEQIERAGGTVSLQKLWDQLKGRSVAELERLEVRGRRR